VKGWLASTGVPAESESAGVSWTVAPHVIDTVAGEIVRVVATPGRGLAGKLIVTFLRCYRVRLLADRSRPDRCGVFIGRVALCSSVRMGGTLI
jgi:hypothetical protein